MLFQQFEGFFLLWSIPCSGNGQVGWFQETLFLVEVVSDKIAADSKQNFKTKQF
jgi:hypothetical protein